MKISKIVKVLATGSFLLLGLSGCFLFDGPAPDAPVRQEVQLETTDPQFFPEGDASQNKDYFIFTLQNFSKSETEFNSINIANTLVEAGFDKENMQISFDESLTNLPTDTVTVSVLFGKECLLGQVERKDRKVFVHQTNAVGPDKNICILGDTLDF